jgi:putative methyltransferase
MIKVGRGNSTKSKTRYLNPTVLYLDSYIQEHDPSLHLDIQWVFVPEYVKSQDELVRLVTEHNIDILCISLYLWNISHSLSMIRNIRSLLQEKVTIIAGGPALDVDNDTSIVEANLDIDYFVYSHGERALLTILQSIVNNAPLNASTVKNCVWKDHATNIIQKTPFEFIKVKSSPFIKNKDLFRYMVVALRECCSDDTDIDLTYASTRGCPFTCTFCDWTKGLSSTVSVRNSSAMEELQVFSELGIHRLYLADANFGMYPTDLTFVDAVIKFRTELNVPFTFTGQQWSKVKKEQVFSVANKLLHAGVISVLKVSIQDSHQEVLSNIERPDVPWEELVAHINTLRVQHPGVHIVFELICGLPGQTPKLWQETIEQCLSVGNSRILVHPLLVIPNSIMSTNQEYIQRMGIKTIGSKITIGGHDQIENYPLAVETLSFNRDDFARMLILSFLANKLSDSDSELRKEFTNIYTLMVNHVRFGELVLNVSAALSDLDDCIRTVLRFVNSVIDENYISS